MLINKDIREEDLSRITKETFNYLKYLGITARIGDIVYLLEKATGFKIDVNFQALWNSQVLSDLLDYQKSFLSEGIEISDLKDYIFRTLEFPKRLIRVLENDNIEDRLLAIMLSITLPSHDYFNLSNDKND